MPTFNNTFIGETEFVLHCFAGEWSWWKGLLSAFLLFLFLVASSANLTLLVTVRIERHLHTPMYYFICILSFLDLALCFSLFPPILNSLLFDIKSISEKMCFAQIYIITSMFGIQSGLFMVMACDRYIAICKPLQYPLIIADHYLLKASSVAIVRGSVLSLPMVVLTAQLNYCDRNLIGQCFCETLTVANLACVKNNVINMYVFVTVLFTTGFDMVLISFSYCMIVRAVLRLKSKEAASKTFSTCASHLVVISYYYSSEVLLIITSVMGEKITSEVHTLLAILFSLIPPALNPVVYGLRTTKIREKIFSMIKKS